MTCDQTIAPVSELKAQARRLRTQLRDNGVALSHGQALDLLARQHGLRDWNTLSARAGNEIRLQVGDRVTGTYLGRAFAGVVKSLTVLDDAGYRRISVHFDMPVDVVRFDSFSSFRQRVTGLIGPDGQSPRRTSDGQPQLVVRPEG